MDKKKVPYLNFIPIIIIAIILFKIIYDGEILGQTLNILSPLIGAFAIAYLLEPMVKNLEMQFKISRGWSIFFTYLLILLVIIISIYIITPRISDSITDLVTKTPDYYKKTQQFIEDKAYEIALLEKYGLIDYLESSAKTIFDKASIIIEGTINQFFKQALNITSVVFEIILSMTIAVYMLKDKSRFKIMFKRILYALFDKNKAEKIINISNETNNIFARYLIGKMLDSAIIGVLCFITLSIINIPYTLLISLIVGVTNMIPYFGPFIGAVPAIILTLFSSPIKALYVAITILVLQQFDGLYLGPKILGDKVGIRPFWIITAITIGGAMFGVLGMLLGVPVVAVLKTIADRYVEKRLKEKNITID